MTSSIPTASATNGGGTSGSLRASPTSHADNSKTCPTSGWTTGKIAEMLGGRLDGPADLRIHGASGLDDAQPGMLTFIRSGKFARLWAKSQASAALISEGLEPTGHDSSKRALIYVPDADVAMIRILGALLPAMHAPDPGVHPTAVIDQTAIVAATARVGAYCVIGPGSRVGEGTVLMPGVKLGANVMIGPGSLLHPGVVIYDRCTIGGKTILHAGVIVGADGFGYHPDPQGKGILKIPHIGAVTIGNGVEIGANSCIDRGKFGFTSIGDGTKIDNLVQIGHNVKIGRACLICGMTGIGGSVTIGDGVIIAGHSGVADGVTIGARATITAKSGVISDVPAGATYSGLPALPHAEQMRAWAATRYLADHLREFKKAARST